MAATNINRVVLTGNLTRDPELRSTPSGTSVCSLRVACNTRRKDASGEWVDKPNYFDVTVWGAQGENCAQYLSKGRPGGGRRAAGVARVAGQGRATSASRSTSSPTRVQFLGSRDSGDGGGNGSRFTPQSDVPADTADFQPRPGGAAAARTTTSRSERRRAARATRRDRYSRRASAAWLTALASAAPQPPSGSAKGSSWLRRYCSNR